MSSVKGGEGFAPPLPLQKGVPQVHSTPSTWRDAVFAQVARRTGFGEQYYTGMKKFYSAGKVAGRNVKKTMCKIWSVFH